MRCIDLDETRFELLFECGQVVANRLCEQGQARLGNQVSLSCQV